MLVLSSCMSEEVEIILPSGNATSYVDNYGNIKYKIKINIENNSKDTITLDLINDAGVGDVQPMITELSEGYKVLNIRPRGNLDYGFYMRDTILPKEYKTLFVFLSPMSLPVHDCELSFVTIAYEKIQDKRARPYHNNYINFYVPLVRIGGGYLVGANHVVSGFNEKTLENADFSSLSEFIRSEEHCN